MEQVTGRYEAIEINGLWYVLDHRHPENEPAQFHNEAEATTAARIWNMVTAA